MSKLFAIITFLCLIISDKTLAQPGTRPTRCPPRCTAIIRCSNEESPVWAIDGRRCRVFRNPCLLANENCTRSRQCRPPLLPTTAAICSRLCPFGCTTQFDPVCAEYNGVRRTFSNQCTLSMHICRSGQTYQFLFRGSCGRN